MSLLGVGVEDRPEEFEEAVDWVGPGKRTQSRGTFFAAARNRVGRWFAARLLDTTTAQFCCHRLSIIVGTRRALTMPLERRRRRKIANPATP